MLSDYEEEYEYLMWWQCFDEGYHAFLAGKANKTNPYNPYSKESQDWSDGWCRAKNDEKMREEQY